MDISIESIPWDTILRSIVGYHMPSTLEDGPTPHRYHGLKITLSTPTHTLQYVLNPFNRPKSVRKFLHKQNVLKLPFYHFQRLGMAEDCLTLDIYRPIGDDKGEILFWIHGGGFALGDSYTYSVWFQL